MDRENDTLRRFVTAGLLPAGLQRHFLDVTRPVRAART
jgi:hypothetical protein